MTLLELQKSVRDLFVLIFDDQDEDTADLKVIWANESGVRPKLPYVSLNFINPGMRMGSKDNIEYAGDDAFQVVGQRSATLSVNAFGDEAIQQLMNFRDALETAEAMDYTREQQISIVPDGKPKDLSELVDTKIEKRAQLDLSVGYTVSIEENYGPIDSVEVNNVINEETITVEV